MVKETKFDASILFLIGIIAVLIAGAIFIVTVLRPDPDALLKDRVVHSLFVIESNNKPLSSYVLMYYPANKRAAIFDIPGDIGLILKKINMVDRIDAVYDPRNISAFRNEIESLLDIDISFSFILDMVSMGKLVDLLEGVEILIPLPIEQYDTEPPVLFSSGLTRMDGDKARIYISYALPDEDRETITFRRQRFFLGLLRRIGEQNESLKNPVLAQMYQLLLRTNTNQRTLLRLFDEYTGINIDRLNIQIVGGSIREISGQTLLLPNYNGNLIKDIVRKTLGGLTTLDQGESDRVWTVEVLNGTTANGLAGRTADLLRDFGYDVVSIGNADRNDYDATVIVDHSGSRDIAWTFANTIRCKNVLFEAVESEYADNELQNFEYRLDFTIIIGKDFDGRYVTGS
jgi:anionic cell wall polymer biosynthesis LytR-Cps2A-Psr (LCP) family protein